MPALDLELNSSSFLSGASAINSSIDGLIRGSGNLDNALLGVGNALQNFSMVGRDIKRMQGDLNAVTGQSVGIWGTLGAAIKANPVFAIATVLGVAASAMTLFSNATNQATEAQKKLADAIRTVEDARGMNALRTRLGGSPSASGRLQSEISALEQFAISPQNIEQADLVKLLGYKPQFDIGDAVLREYYKKVGVDDYQTRYAPTTQIRADVARNLAESRLRNLYLAQRYNESEGAYQSGGGSSSRGGSSRYSFGKGLAGIGIGRGISPDPFGANGDMGGVSTTVEQSLRAMQEMRALGEDIGQTLGNAFDRATQAGATFKSVLQGVLQDLRSIATSLVSSWLRDSVGSAFGGTPRGR